MHLSFPTVSTPVTFDENSASFRQLGCRVDKLAKAVCVAVMLISVFRILRPFAILPVSIFDTINEVASGFWCLVFALLALYALVAAPGRYKFITPLPIALCFGVIAFLVNIGIIGYNITYANNLLALSDGKFWQLEEFRDWAYAIISIYAVLLFLEIWFIYVLYRAYKFLEAKFIAGLGRAVQYFPSPGQYAMPAMHVFNGSPVYPMPYAIGQAGPQMMGPPVYVNLPPQTSNLSCCSLQQPVAAVPKQK